MKKMSEKLIWRLKEKPTAEGVAMLVENGVINRDEAREILFSESDKNKLLDLEEEVKFLRSLCDKLAAKNNSWPTIIREYREYTPNRPYWYKAYGPVMGIYSPVTIGYSQTTQSMGIEESGTSRNVSKGNIANAVMSTMSKSNKPTFMNASNVSAIGTADTDRKTMLSDLNK